LIGPLPGEPRSVYLNNHFAGRGKDVFDIPGIGHKAAAQALVFLHRGGVVRQHLGVGEDADFPRPVEADIAQPLFRRLGHRFGGHGDFAGFLVVAHADDVFAGRIDEADRLDADQVAVAVPVDLEVALLEVLEFLDRGVAGEIDLDDLYLFFLLRPADLSLFKAFVQLDTCQITVELHVVGAGTVYFDLGIEADRDVTAA